MKFKILITGFIILSLSIYLLRIYIPDTKTASGNELYSCGYVPYVDSFLCIDMDGKVLSVTDSVYDNLPVIEGLSFNNFTIGSCLETDNSEVFSTVANLIMLFKKYELGDNFINKINVADLDDIHLYTNNVEVAFGSDEDADEKIRTLKEIIANLHVAENVKGLLDIRVIGRQYIFTVLT